ncbi:MAG: efflux RND transporter periplasmic adaptor subunit [Nitrospirota bacterium]|nr:efflux RND transporter periplasmic adaptor subunit [Nitrospirota bacterium]
MDKIRLTPKYKRWIVLGLAMVVLAGVLLFLDNQVWPRVLVIIEQTSQLVVGADHDMTWPDKMAAMGEMAMPVVMEKASEQAAVMVTPVRQQLIGVKTAVVGKQQLETAIRAVGKVDYDEQRIAHVNLRISGWVEDLFVDYTGQLVRKRQPLFTLYSPDLVAAQDEYLLALRAEEQVQDSPLPEVREQAAQMVQAARDRLRLWTITDQQITELARRGTAQTYLTIFSPIAGHVIDKQVFKGMFVEPQTKVYAIADLSAVWVHAEIYEYEVPFVRVGQSATLTLDAYPGESFHGRVTYIYPYMNKEARTLKVRLEFQNPGLRLKPDMYGTVVIRVDRGHKLAVPDLAVLDSGIRKIVFVAKGKGLFEPRQVTLGPKVGPYYEVIEGLVEGERIVTSGTFLLDSESKLMASTSMMGALGMGGIKMEQAQMGKMEMPGMKMEMNADD